MALNSYAVWFADQIAGLPDGMTYYNGFYVFNGVTKFADYNLAMKYYDEQVRQGWVNVPDTVAPLNLTAPTVTGKVEANETVTVDEGTWEGTEPLNFTYQWQIDNVDAASGKNKTFYVLNNYSPKLVRCKVTATNSVGTSTANTENYGPVRRRPYSTESQVISGTPLVGETLTKTAGSFGGYPDPTLTYQWQRDSGGEYYSPIQGETGNSYVITEEDAGRRIRLMVTATNELGNSSSPSSIIHVQQAPVNTSAPYISGVPNTAYTLAVGSGNWVGPPTPTYTYQWQRGTTDIVGATSSSYKPTEDDVGSTIRCIVTATNSVGSNTAITSSIGPVTAAA